MASKFGVLKAPAKNARPSHFAQWLNTPEGQEAFLKQMERMTIDGPLRREAAEVEAIIHDAKYHVLCEMLGDQSRLTMLGFLSQRPECGCPEVYAKLDHEAMGATIAPPKGESYPTICQNPDCPEKEA